MASDVFLALCAIEVRFGRIERLGSFVSRGGSMPGVVMVVTSTDQQWEEDRLERWESRKAPKAWYL